MDDKLFLLQFSRGAAKICRAFLAGLFAPVAALLCVLLVVYVYVLLVPYHWLNGRLENFGASEVFVACRNLFLNIYDWVFDERF